MFGLLVILVTSFIVLVLLWDASGARYTYYMPPAGSSKPLGFAFGASGLLMGFHIGAAKCLTENLLLNSDTPLAGTSGGSVLVVCVRCGIPFDKLEQMYIECVSDLRKNGTIGRASVVLRRFLESSLPDNAHELCSGSVYIGVTELLPHPRYKLVSSFASRTDLIHTILSSCHIPLYSDGHVAHRGCVDGGFSYIIPTLPDCYDTIKISTLPAWLMKGMLSLNKRESMLNVTIVPSDHMKGRCKSMLFPVADTSFYRHVVQLGYKDALAQVVHLRNRQRPY